MLADATLWLPLRLGGDYAGRRSGNYVPTGRLLPGVTVEQAQSELSGVAARLAAVYPENEGRGIRVAALREATTSRARSISSTTLS